MLFNEPLTRLHAKILVYHYFIKVIKPLEDEIDELCKKFQDANINDKPYIFMDILDKKVELNKLKPDLDRYRSYYFYLEY